MLHAMRLAIRGEGRVEPNPMVGCVIAKKDRIIGQGYHRSFGGPHAEVEALRTCTENPRGAWVYVSLEPCRHHGKTPPCTDALIDAGVARVFIAAKDPNRSVSGEGAQVLAKAGIAVHEGLCQREGVELIAPFITCLTKKRPFVIAKWAQSLDGKLATRTGHSQWISCETSRKHVHRTRARVDAVLVGSGTLLADDPELTARDVPLRRRALRVVLDSRLRISTRHRLVTTAPEFPTLVMTCSEKSNSPKAERLRRQGVDVTGCKAQQHRLSLKHCLKLLLDRGVTNILAEGGPTVLTSLFEQRLVDQAHVFVAPILIGGDKAPGPLEGKGPLRVQQALVPQAMTTRRSGTDMFYSLRFDSPVE